MAIAGEQRQRHGNFVGRPRVSWRFVAGALATASRNAPPGAISRSALVAAIQHRISEKDGGANAPTSTSSTPTSTRHRLPAAARSTAASARSATDTGWSGADCSYPVVRQFRRAPVEPDTGVAAPGRSTQYGFNFANVSTMAPLRAARRR